MLLANRHTERKKVLLLSVRSTSRLTHSIRRLSTSVRTGRPQLTDTHLNVKWGDEEKVVEGKDRC